MSIPRLLPPLPPSCPSPTLLRNVLSHPQQVTHKGLVTPIVTPPHHTRSATFPLLAPLLPICL